MEFPALAGDRDLPGDAAPPRLLVPLEEHGPVVLLIAAYIGIGWMLWLSRNRIGA